MEKEKVTKNIIIQRPGTDVHRSQSKTGSEKGSKNIQNSSINNRNDVGITEKTKEWCNEFG